MAAKRVLVTGSAGAIGTVVVAALAERGHQVRGFDRAPCPALADHQLGDLTDAAALRTATSATDVVVHLAATPDRADFVSELVPNNVIGLYRLFEAAREAKVARVVVASTIRVAAGHDWNRQAVRVADGLAPHDHYSLTKAWAEVMAEFYARSHGIEMIVARIAWFVRNEREAAHMRANPGSQNHYLSHADAARFFVRAVEATVRFPGPVPCAAMFVASRPATRSAFHLDEARELLGFEPQDVWPQGSPWSSQQAPL